MTYRFKTAIVIAFLLCLSATLHATIRRVNNMPGSSAPYATLYAAITAAVAGDTLHIEGSPNVYYDLNTNKRLVVIGPGYFLNETNANPNTQYNRNSAVVVNVRLQPGSKGSVIMGLEIQNSVAVSDSFMTFQRNTINNTAISLAYTAPSFGDTIRNNYFAGSSQVSNSGSYKSNGLMVYNNLFVVTYNGIYISNLTSASGYVINNCFISSSPITFNCSNFTFQNNIFNKANFGSLAPSNIFLKNMAFSGIPAGGGDSLGVNMNDVYLGWPTAGPYSSDGRFRLKANAPAVSFGILAGTPVDCGAFGGPAPYILSGMPPVPSIYELQAPETVPSGTSQLNISVSATSEH